MRKRVEQAREKILGGAFPLELPGEGCSPAPPLFGSDAQYFLSVRCALLALCRRHGPGAAWLPSYLCGALCEPFASSRIPIRYYGVDENLSVADANWIDEIREGDLVLVIHYFGFPNLSFPADRVRARGGLVVEDASQALFLSKQFPESRCILYSPRKFLGVPDGGVLLGGGTVESLDEPPLAWWRDAVAMTLKRREFDLTGRSNNWHAMFRRVEAAFPLGLYRASDLARVLIESADFDAIRTRRRANYARLAERIGRHALFPELGPDAVPLGFPVRVEPGIRDRVLRTLHGSGIYAPVHWAIRGIVPDSFQPSHTLASSCLTLICDQRCSTSDMDWQAEVFSNALTRAAGRRRSGSVSR
jgi:hypothetical protein